MTLSKFAKLFYPEFTDPKYADRIENQFLEYRMRFDMWFLMANLDKRTKFLEFVRPHLKLLETKNSSRMMMIMMMMMINVNNQPRPQPLGIIVICGADQLCRLNDDLIIIIFCFNN
jgi:hypothetical protein